MAATTNPLIHAEKKRWDAAKALASKARQAGVFKGYSQKVVLEAFSKAFKLPREKQDVFFDNVARSNPALWQNAETARNMVSQVINPLFKQEEIPSLTYQAARERLAASDFELDDSMWAGAEDFTDGVLKFDTWKESYNKQMHPTVYLTKMENWADKVGKQTPELRNMSPQGIVSGFRDALSRDMETQRKVFSRLSETSAYYKGKSPEDIRRDVMRQVKWQTRPQDPEWKDAALNMGGLTPASRAMEMLQRQKKEAPAEKKEPSKVRPQPTVKDASPVDAQRNQFAASQNQYVKNYLASISGMPMGALAQADPTTALDNALTKASEEFESTARARTKVKLSEDIRSQQAKSSETDPAFNQTSDALTDFAYHAAGADWVPEEARQKIKIKQPGFAVRASQNEVMYTDTINTASPDDARKKIDEISRKLVAPKPFTFEPTEPKQVLTEDEDEQLNILKEAVALYEAQAPTLAVLRRKNKEFHVARGKVADHLRSGKIKRTNDGGYTAESDVQADLDKFLELRPFEKDPDQAVWKEKLEYATNRRIGSKELERRKRELRSYIESAQAGNTEVSVGQFQKTQQLLDALENVADPLQGLTRTNASLDADYELTQNAKAIQDLRDQAEKRQQALLEKYPGIMDAVKRYNELFDTGILTQHGKYVRTTDSRYEDEVKDLLKKLGAFYKDPEHANLQKMDEQYKSMVEEHQKLQEFAEKTIGTETKVGDLDAAFRNMTPENYDKYIQALSIQRDIENQRIRSAQRNARELADKMSERRGPARGARTMRMGDMIVSLDDGMERKYVEIGKRIGRGENLLDAVWNEQVIDKTRALLVNTELQGTREESLGTIAEKSLARAINDGVMTPFAGALWGALGDATVAEAVQEAAEKGYAAMSPEKRDLLLALAGHNEVQYLKNPTALGAVIDQGVYGLAAMVGYVGEYAATLPIARGGAEALKAAREAGRYSAGVEGWVMDAMKLRNLKMMADDLKVVTAAGKAVDFTLDGARITPTLMQPGLRVQTKAGQAVKTMVDNQGVIRILDPRTSVQVAGDLFKRGVATMIGAVPQSFAGGLGHIISNTYQRQTPNVLIDWEVPEERYSDGVDFLKAKGITIDSSPKESWATSIIMGVLQNYFEYATEASGGALIEGLQRAGGIRITKDIMGDPVKLAGALAPAIRPGIVGGMRMALGKNAWKTQFYDIMRFHGFTQEFSEEVLNGVSNAVSEATRAQVTGDGSFDEVLLKNLEQNLSAEQLGSIALTIGAWSMLSSIGSIPSLAGSLVRRLGRPSGEEIQRRVHQQLNVTRTSLINAWAVDPRLRGRKFDIVFDRENLIAYPTVDGKPVPGIAQPLVEGINPQQSVSPGLVVATNPFTGQDAVVPEDNPFFVDLNELTASMEEGIRKEVLSKIPEYMNRDNDIDYAYLNLLLETAPTKAAQEAALDDPLLRGYVEVKKTEDDGNGGQREVTEQRFDMSRAREQKLDILRSADPANEVLRRENKAADIRRKRETALAAKAASMNRVNLSSNRDEAARQMADYGYSQSQIDYALDSYDQIPQWIADIKNTLPKEIQDQLVDGELGDIFDRVQLVLGLNSNGEYDTGSKTIKVSPVREYPGVKGQRRSFITTVAHEVVHNINQVVAPEVRDYLGQLMETDQDVRQQLLGVEMENYLRKGGYRPGGYTTNPDTGQTEYVVGNLGEEAVTEFFNQYLSKAATSTSTRRQVETTVRDVLTSVRVPDKVASYIAATVGVSAKLADKFGFTRKSELPKSEQRMVDDLLTNMFTNGFTTPEKLETERALSYAKMQEAQAQMNKARSDENRARYSAEAQKQQERIQYIDGMLEKARFITPGYQRFDGSLAELQSRTVKAMRHTVTNAAATNVAEAIAELRARGYNDNTTPGEAKTLYTELDPADDIQAISRQILEARHNLSVKAVPIQMDVMQRLQNLTLPAWERTSDDMKIAYAEEIASRVKDVTPEAIRRLGIAPSISRELADLLVTPVAKPTPVEAPPVEAPVEVAPVQPTPAETPQAQPIPAAPVTVAPQAPAPGAPVGAAKPAPVGLDRTAQVEAYQRVKIVADTLLAKGDFVIPDGVELDSNIGETPYTFNDIIDLPSIKYDAATRTLSRVEEKKPTPKKDSKDLSTLAPLKKKDGVQARAFITRKVMEVSEEGEQEVIQTWYWVDTDKAPGGYGDPNTVFYFAENPDGTGEQDKNRSTPQLLAQLQAIAPLKSKFNEVSFDEYETDAITGTPSRIRGIPRVTAPDRIDPRIREIREAAQTLLDRAVREDWGTAYAMGGRVPNAADKAAIRATAEGRLAAFLDNPEIAPAEIRQAIDGFLAIVPSRPDLAPRFQTSYNVVESAIDALYEGNITFDELAAVTEAEYARHGMAVQIDLKPYEGDLSIVDRSDLSPVLYDAAWDAEIRTGRNPFSVIESQIGSGTQSHVMLEGNNVYKMVARGFYLSRNNISRTDYKVHLDPYGTHMWGGGPIAGLLNALDSQMVPGMLEAEVLAYVPGKGFLVKQAFVPESQLVQQNPNYVIGDDAVQAYLGDLGVKKLPDSVVLGKLTWSSGDIIDHVYVYNGEHVIWDVRGNRTIQDSNIRLDDEGNVFIIDPLVFPLPEHADEFTEGVRKFQSAFNQEDLVSLYENLSLMPQPLVEEPTVPDVFEKPQVYQSAFTKIQHLGLTDPADILFATIHEKDLVARTREEFDAMVSKYKYDLEARWNPKTVQSRDPKLSFYQTQMKWSRLEEALDKDLFVDQPDYELQLRRATTEEARSRIIEDILTKRRSVQTGQMEPWFVWLVFGKSERPDIPDSFATELVRQVMTYNIVNGPTGQKRVRRTPDSEKDPMSYDKQAVRDTYEAFKENPTQDLVGLYARVATNWSVQQVEARKVEETPQGLWLRYPSKSNDTGDHSGTVLELQTMAAKTDYAPVPWCTATNAGQQLEGGDFYVYVDTTRGGLDPKVAIRMVGDKIAEVRGVGSYQDVEPQYAVTASVFAKSLDRTYESSHERLTGYRALRQLNNRIKADPKYVMSKKDILDLRKSSIDANAGVEIDDIIKIADFFESVLEGYIFQPNGLSPRMFYEVLSASGAPAHRTAWTYLIQPDTRAAVMELNPALRDYIKNYPVAQVFDSVATLLAGGSLVAAPYEAAFDEDALDEASYYAGAWVDLLSRITSVTGTVIVPSALRGGINSMLPKLQTADIVRIGVEVPAEDYSYNIAPHLLNIPSELVERLRSNQFLDVSGEARITLEDAQLPLNYVSVQSSIVAYLARFHNLEDALIDIEWFKQHDTRESYRKRPRETEDLDEIVELLRNYPEVRLDTGSGVALPSLKDVRSLVVYAPLEVAPQLLVHEELRGYADFVRDLVAKSEISHRDEFSLQPVGYTLSDFPQADTTYYSQFEQPEFEQPTPQTRFANDLNYEPDRFTGQPSALSGDPVEGGRPAETEQEYRVRTAVESALAQAVRLGQDTKGSGPTVTAAQTLERKGADWKLEARRFGNLLAFPRNVLERLNTDPAVIQAVEDFRSAIPILSTKQYSDMINSLSLLGSGIQSTVYRTRDGKTVYKFMQVAFDGVTFQESPLLGAYQVILQNAIPGTAYTEIVGFHMSDHQRHLILKQQFIEGTQPTQAALAKMLMDKGALMPTRDTWITRTPIGDVYFVDALPRNAIQDAEGKVWLIDSAAYPLDSRKDAKKYKPVLDRSKRLQSRFADGHITQEMLDDSSSPLNDVLRARNFRLVRVAPGEDMGEPEMDLMWYEDVLGSSHGVFLPRPLDEKNLDQMRSVVAAMELSAASQSIPYTVEDAQYFEALADNNMELAENMLRQAAEKNGFTAEITPDNIVDYDFNGHIIHPSRRFNPASRDIYYSRFPVEYTVPFEDTGASLRLENSKQAVRDLEEVRWVKNGISQDFRSKGSVSLVGRRVNSMADLAALAQVYRDPRFETLRVFIVRKGQIVHNYGVTSRMADSVQYALTASPQPSSRGLTAKMFEKQRQDDFTKFMGELARNMGYHEGDSYYLLHNHPISMPTPSVEDFASTWELVKNVPGFAGHVIINTNSYGIIRPSDLEQTYTVFTGYKQDEQDPMMYTLEMQSVANGAIQREYVKKRFESEDALQEFFTNENSKNVRSKDFGELPQLEGTGFVGNVADIAWRMQNGENTITVITTNEMALSDSFVPNMQPVVTSVSELPADLLADYTRFQDALFQIYDNTNAANLYIANVPERHRTSNALYAARKDGLVTDVIQEDGSFAKSLSDFYHPYVRQEVVYFSKFDLTPEYYLSQREIHESVLDAMKVDSAMDEEQLLRFVIPEFDSYSEADQTAVRRHVHKSLAAFNLSFDKLKMPTLAEATEMHRAVGMDEPVDVEQFVKIDTNEPVLGPASPIPGDIPSEVYYSKFTSDLVLSDDQLIRGWLEWDTDKRRGFKGSEHRWVKWIRSAFLAKTMTYADSLYALKRMQVLFARIRPDLTDPLMTAMRNNTNMGPDYALFEMIDPYLQEELVTGLTGEQLQDFRDFLEKEFFEYTRKNNITEQDVHTMMYALHAIERNYQIAQRNTNFGQSIWAKDANGNVIFNNGAPIRLGAVFKDDIHPKTGENLKEGQGSGISNKEAIDGFDMDGTHVPGLVEMFEIVDVTIKDIAAGTQRVQRVKAYSDIQMTDTEIIASVDVQTPKNDALWNATRMVDQMLKDNRERMFLGGLIDKSTKDLWENTYKYYIPLKTLESGMKSGTYARLSVGGEETKPAFGRTSYVQESLLFILSHIEHSIVRVNTNHVARTFGRFLMAISSPEGTDLNNLSWQNADVIPLIDENGEVYGYKSKIEYNSSAEYLQDYASRGKIKIKRGRDASLVTKPLFEVNARTYTPSLNANGMVQYHVNPFADTDVTTISYKDKGKEFKLRINYMPLVIGLNHLVGRRPSRYTDPLDLLSDIDPETIPAGLPWNDRLGFAIAKGLNTGGVFRKMMRWFGQAVTAYSPYFLMYNAQRDAGAAALNILSEYHNLSAEDWEKYRQAGYVAETIEGIVPKKPFSGARMAGDIWRNVGPQPKVLGPVRYLTGPLGVTVPFANLMSPAGRAIRHAIQEEDGKGFNANSLSAEDRKWLNYYKELKTTGGLVHFYTAADYRNIADMIKEGMTPTRHKSVSKWVPGILKFVENANKIVESSTRLAAYVAARESGMSKQRASSLSKNLTVNFNRKGLQNTTPAKFVSTAYLFANANIQGIQRFFQIVAKNPMLMLRKGPGFMIVAGAIFSFLNRILGGEDKDGRDVWDHYDITQKMRNLHILLDDKRAYSMKLPFGFNIPFFFGTMLESCAQYFFSDGRKGVSYDEAGIAVMGAIASYVDVAGTGVELGSKDAWKDAANAFIPSLGRMPMQLIFNRNWAGAQIYPESRNEAIPKKERSFGRAGAPAEWIADFVYPRVDVSPDQVRYVLDTMGGGLLRAAVETVDFFNDMRTAKGPKEWGGLPEYILNRAPLIKQTLPEYRDKFTRNRFEQYIDRVDAINAFLKQLETEANNRELTTEERRIARERYVDINRKYGKLLAIGKDLRRTRSRINSEYNTLKKWRRDPNISAVQVAEKDDGIRNMLMDINVRFENELRQVGYPDLW